mgnify:FL=1
MDQGQVILEECLPDDVFASTGPAVCLTSSPEVAEINGEYLVNKEIARSSEQSRDQILQEQFWQISAEMVGLA